MSKQSIESIVKKGLTKYRGRPSEKVNKALAKNLCRLLKGVPSESCIIRYRAQRAIEGAAVSSVNRELGLLRTIMRDQGLPLPARWHTATEPVSIRVMTPGDYQQIRAELDKGTPPRHAWAGHLLDMLILSGARIGELLSVMPGEYDTETGAVQVWAPKEAVPKVVMMPGRAKLAADILYFRYGSFRRPGYTEKQSYFSFLGALKRACKRAGVKTYTPHDLRRTFASWAIQGGATLEQVGQCLGHRSVETTRRRYARLDQATRMQVAMVVERRALSSAEETAEGQGFSRPPSETPQEGRR